MTTESGTFLRDLLRLLLVFLPLAYVFLIASTVAHEALGHGLAAVLSGGEFLRFEVQFDGMGRAWTRGASNRDFVLAAGIAVETLLGVVALIAGVRGPRSLLVRLAFLVLATSLFHDGLPYGFWGAVWGGTKGDVSLILLERPELRAPVALGFGVLYLTLDAITSWAILRIVEEALGPSSRARALVIAVVSTVGYGAGYFAFDMDQLVQDVGQRPAWAGLTFHALVGAMFVLRPRVALPPSPVPARTWRAWIAFSWLAAAATVGAVALWLRPGITLQ